MDNTSDLARVLRIPGTMNRKREPIPVSVLTEDLSNRYQLAAIEEVFKKTGSPFPGKDSRTDIQQKPDFSEGPPADPGAHRRGVCVARPLPTGCPDARRARVVCHAFYCGAV